LENYCIIGHSRCLALAHSGQKILVSNNTLYLNLDLKYDENHHSLIAVCGGNGNGTR
jgi:hypothetical protein